MKETTILENLQEDSRWKREAVFLRLLVGVKGDSLPSPRNTLPLF